MSPNQRRILQAVCYELGAIAMTWPIFGLGFGESAGSALLLATVLSTIALSWNFVFNALFERWEAAQPTRGRSLQRRVLHGIGFEGGLVVMLVPVLAWWLETTLWQAFLAELGLLLMFFVYAVAFTWAFDKLFGLPVSAQPR